MKTRRELSVLVVMLVGLGLGLNALAAPPSEGMRLWLAADNIALADGQIVEQWLDMSGRNNHANRQWGDPRLQTAPFPAGDGKVVRFTGNDGFKFSEAGAIDLHLNGFTIYAVASVDAGVMSQIIIANYVDVNGFSVGISDYTPQIAKFFTAPDVAHIDTLMPTQELVAEVPTIITAIYDPNDVGNKKSMYFNLKLVGTSPGAGVGYSAGAIATVGVLDVGRQFFKGDIAEILVYDSVDAQQKMDVEDYLTDKYGVVPCTVFNDMDFNRDCYVDLEDFGEFAQQWLKCTDPTNEACVLP